ncbi:MAG: hypothetical protein WAK29_04050 [Terriglobales bacterium]
MFLAETLPSDLNANLESSRRKLRRREHFWLCEACSAHFTLRFDSNQGMLTVPLGAHGGPRYLTRAAASA